MNYIISDIDQYYSTFEYPQEFIISIQKGIVDWGSWYIVPEQRADVYKRQDGRLRLQRP